MTLQKHLLIDGNGLSYRSLYAEETLFIQTPKRTVYTGIPYGFLRTMLAVKKQYHPEKIIVFWDSRESRKKEIYPNYKANRKAQFPEGMTIDDVVYSMKVCKKLLHFCGISQYTEPREEADDLISTHVARNPDALSIVLSSDHDFFQLLRYENTRFLKIGQDQMIMWNLKEFVKKYGFEPIYYPHYLSIVGDKTDNIPGIRGIGKETAKKMFLNLKEPTLKNIMLNLDSLPVTPKIREKMRGGRNDLSIFLKLTRLRTDIELKPMFDPTDPDKESLEKLMEYLKFRSLLNDLDILCE